MINYLLNLNFYIFKKSIFFNKIIFDQLIKVKNNYFLNIENYYLNLKKTLNYFNPFYGIKIITLLDKIKNTLKKKKEKKQKIYKIPYRELSYIFKLSIEKIRIKKKKNV